VLITYLVKMRKKDFGQRLREARERAGLRREELAVKLGVSVYSIARWEQGRNKPLPEFRRRLKEILGVDLDT